MYMKRVHNKTIKQNIKNKINKTPKMSKSKNTKKNAQWITAIEAADISLSKTGSINKAHDAFRKQALFNARKLFGSVGKVL